MPSAPDIFGDHAVSCGVAGECIVSLHHLRDALYSTAVSAQLAPLQEERALLPDSNERPADIMIPNWAGGRDMAFDVTVVNPLRADYLLKTADDPKHALTTTFNPKRRKYGPNCEREGITFIPLPALTLGAWHETAIQEFKQVGRALLRANVGRTMSASDT